MGGIKLSSICDNTLRLITESKENVDSVINFFNNRKTDLDYSIDLDGYETRIYFNSKWNFPEEEMIELFNTIPNKDDLYMTCLSVEYENLYHALFTCDENGWHYEN